jgi:hypothetical protein
MDPSDATGGTAYVTVMGFTGGAGHVWMTTNYGTAWTDFTANLPDSPANAVVVDGTNAQVYVGTDVGVFVSSTASANWTEVGPDPNTDQSGFLPNVAVTALGLFDSGGEELLRASTYGRGVWQYPIAATADYTLAISNSPLSDFAGQNAIFTGTANAVNGYSSAVALSCVAGTTAPPSTCTISPPTVTPGSDGGFTVTVAGAVGDYNFNVQGVGSDSNSTTHLVPLTLYIVSFALTTPSPSTVTVPRGTMSSPVNFEVTAAGSFNQSVTVSCSVPITNAVCTLTPGTTVSPTSSDPVTMTASVSVPAATAPGNYMVTIQATTSGAPASLSTDFTLNVTTNPNFTLSEPSGFPEVIAGSTGVTGPIAITSQDGFSGAVALSCANTFGTNSCSISPSTVSSFPATATLTINGTSFVAGSYSLAVTGTSGSITHSVMVPFNVGDYSISGTQLISVNPGQQGTANLTLTSSYFYSGNINATCDASALSGAQCVISPANPITLAADGTKNVTVSVNVPNNAAIGQYNIIVQTQDVNGTPSHSLTLALTVTENFIVFSATPIQAVAPGQTTGAYSLSIQPVGNSFNAPVTLSCSGLPAGAQCLFNPSTPVTPGTNAIDVVVSISTPSTINLQRGMRRHSIRRHAALFGIELFAPGIVILCALRRRGRKRASKRTAILATLVLLTIAFLSCSGVSSGGGGGGSGNCSAVPDAPAAPESSVSLTLGENGTVPTTLTWLATDTNPACTDSYNLYENESSTPLASVPNPTYGAQLSSGTYSFTVAAQNSIGASAPSPPIDLGVYQVTINGTSGNLTNQATVFLVVSSNPAP